MTLEVYNISNGIPMGKAVIGGGNVEADGMIYQFMGSVATYTALLALDTTDFKPGYVYDVQEDGMDYAWNGTGWNSLGGTHVEFDLGAREPLVISADADITVSGQIEYDESTERLNFKQGTPAGEGGSITFTIPADVNVDALNDYWRIGTKTHNLHCAPTGTDRWANYNVLEVFDEDDNVVSRVWYGSSDYRKGKSASTGYYFGSDVDRVSKDIMHHNAGESATYQEGDANADWSAECTISSKRLKYFVLYYNSMSWSGTSMGLGIYDENSYDGQLGTYGLSDIRLFRSPTDTEGILLKGDGGSSVKLNISSGLAVQNGNLVVDSTATVMTSGDQTIGGDKYFSGLQSENVYISGGEAAWLSYVSSGGAVLGRPDANHITLPTNSQDLVQVTRGGSTYTNVDSGNIGSYITGVDSTFSDESTNALQNKVITDSLMDFNNGSYVIYGSPTINSDVISNLSTTNYIETKYKFNCTSSDTWELTIWISGFDYTTSPFVLTNSVDGTKSIEMGFSGEKAYLKASSDGSTWDIADTVIGDTSNFIGGDKGFRIEYNNGYIYTWEVNSGGYLTQYRSFSGVPYNTNSPIRIYSSVTDNTLSIDLSKSAMSVNNVTVWDGAAGELICTPKFPQSSDIRTIDKLTQAEYDALVQAGTVDASTLYIIV